MCSLYYHSLCSYFSTELHVERRGDADKNCLSTFLLGLSVSATGVTERKSIYV